MGPEPDDRIQIGVVGKPHGVRGGFKLERCIDAPALQPGLELEIDGRSWTLAERRGTDKEPLLTLAELGDRDAVRELRGRPVCARRAELTPLGPDEFYEQDLIGLVVRGRDGREWGRIERLQNLPSVDVVEVVADGGGEPLLIPLVRDAVLELDPERGLLVDAEFLALG